jgi:hypothetical protein
MRTPFNPTPEYIQDCYSRAIEKTRKESGEFRNEIHPLGHGMLWHFTRVFSGVRYRKKLIRCKKKKHQRRFIVRKFSEQLRKSTV